MPKSLCGSKVTYSHLWTFETLKGELHFMRDMDVGELRAFTNTGGWGIQSWHLKTQGYRRLLTRQFGGTPIRK